MALYYRPSHPHVSAQLSSFSKFIIWPSFTKMTFSHSGSLFIFALRMIIVFTSPLFVATHSSSSPSHHALGDGHGCMCSTGGVGTGELDRRRARESTAVRGRRMTEPQSLPAIPNNVPCASRIDPLSILRLHDAPTAAAPLLISKSGAKTTQNHPAMFPTHTSLSLSHQPFKHTLKQPFIRLRTPSAPPVSLAIHASTRCQPRVPGICSSAHSPPV